VSLFPITLSGRWEAAPLLCTAPGPLGGTTLVGEPVRVWCARGGGRLRRCCAQPQGQLAGECVSVGLSVSQCVSGRGGRAPRRGASATSFTLCAARANEKIDRPPQNFPSFLRPYRHFQKVLYRISSKHYESRTTDPNGARGRHRGG
jgi:hypothetical protein